MQWNWSKGINVVDLLLYYTLYGFDVSHTESNNQVNGCDRMMLLQVEYDLDMDAIEKLFVEVML